MNNTKVGALISALRKEKNYTQQDLADALGVTNKAVSKWERGDGYPEITIIPALAETLGVTVDELLAGERAMVKAQPTKSEESGQERYRWLLEQALTKYKNLSLVVMGLVLVGLTASCVLLFTCERGIIGYGVNFLMLIISGVMYYIIHNNILTHEKAYVRKMGNDPVYQKTKVERYKRHMICLWVFFMGGVLPITFALSVGSAIKFGGWTSPMFIFVMIRQSRFLLMAAFVMSVFMNWLKKRYRSRGIIMRCSKLKILGWVMNGLALVSIGYNAMSLVTGALTMIWIGFLISTACNIPLLIATYMNITKYRV